MNPDLRKYTLRNIGSNIFLSWISNLSITTWLISVNVMIFIAVLVVGIFVNPNVLSNLFALNSVNFFQGNIWSLLTSMFMHAGFFHLFVNMFSLYFVGNFLEMLIGKKRYLRFYIIAGLFAGVFFCIFSYFFGVSDIGARLFGSREIFAVGASGAIFGVAGVLCVLVPRNKVYLIAGPLLAVILSVFAQNVISSPNVLALVDLILNIYIISALFVMLSFNKNRVRFALPVKMPFWLLPFVAIIPLMLISLFVNDFPIANSAHLGGLIAGLAYGFYLRLKYKRKVKILEQSFLRP